MGSADRYHEEEERQRREAVAAMRPPERVGHYAVTLVLLLGVGLVLAVLFGIAPLRWFGL